MKAETHPLQVLLVTIAGWVNRHQQRVIEYMAEEIHDRDTKFSLRFRIMLEAAGLGLIKTPFQAPNANAYAQRFVRSIKEECLDRLILFGEEHLRHAIDEYMAHYHRERNHQGLGNELIDDEPSMGTGVVGSTERLGGMLRYYHRAA